MAKACVPAWVLSWKIKAKIFADIIFMFENNLDEAWYAVYLRYIYSFVFGNVDS